MPQLSKADMSVAVGELLNRRPTVGLALGVVRDGDLEFFHGHGVADIASGEPITRDTVFRIASITKTFTAVAVLQLVERGLVALDAPANDYLRGFRLAPASSGWPPATVRHLLTHTSGVPETVHASRSLKYVFGESVALSEPLPTLGDYYRGELSLVAQPGSRFTYTDHNFATLGQLVEDVSGQPLASYFHEHVFGPLGMTKTDLLRSERVRPHLATGYTFGRRGPKAVTDRDWITAAASSIYSSPRDMARYLAALLGGGANEHGRVLSPAMLETMFQPQYRPDPRIPGMGLAFSRFDLGGHRAVEHEGILPGFNSDIFLAPDDGVGVLAFTNGARQAMLWLPSEAGLLLGDLIGARRDRVRTDIAQRPDLWGELCGRYPFPAPLTDLRARSMFGAGAEVFVRRGRLTVRLLSPVPAAYRGFTLHPDDENDPYVFRIDLEEYGIGTARVVFAPDPDTGRTALFFELFPTTLRRRVGPASPGRRVTGALRSAARTARARRENRQSNQRTGGG